MKHRKIPQIPKHFPKWQEKPKPLFPPWPKEVCWFCGNRPADQDRPWKVKMSLRTRGELRQYSWGLGHAADKYNRTKIPLPCCPNCKRCYKRATVAIWLCAAIAVIGGLTFMMLHPMALDLMPGEIACILSPVSFLLFLALGFALRWLIPRRSEIKNNAWSYPTVGEYLMNGWQITWFPG